MMRFPDKFFGFTLMSLIVLFLIGCEKQPTDVVVCDCAPAQWYGYPTWSPTGEWIAYYYSGQEGLQPWGSRGLWLIRPDGSDKQFLTEGVTCDFSPDGKMIALQDYSAQIFIYDLETKTYTQLTFEGLNYRPSWSPAGMMIAYSSGILVLDMRDINGQSIIEIASHKKVSLGEPAWFLDFRIVRSIGTTRNHESTVDLFVVDTVGNILQRLTDSGTSNHRAKVSPDGNKIVWQRWEVENNNDIAVWMMNADGSGKVRLAAGWEPDWSPDGRHIIFRKEGEFIHGQPWDDDDLKVHGSLWIMDVTTRAARQFLPPK